MGRIGGARTFGLTRGVITLYHLGRMDEALKRATEAVAGARASKDPNFRVFALQHLGISLAGAGRYAEANTVFEEMRDFARRHGVLPMLARGIAMMGGVRASLGDYAGGLELAMEARDLAQRISFPPPVVSAGIDLLTIYARSHDPGRADPMLEGVAKAVVAASGWHGWLWRLRFCQARAELALARGDWQGAIAAATEGITNSEARSRPKYVALGYGTRAQARYRSGDRAEALLDADRGLAVSRGLSDPAVHLKALLCRIEIEGTDDLANEARTCREQILSNLDDTALRDRFLSSELAGVT
jgi:tetratricopeptide (TPR) repeat protein